MVGNVITIKMNLLGLWILVETNSRRISTEITRNISNLKLSKICGNRNLNFLDVYSVLTFHHFCLSFIQTGFNCAEDSELKQTNKTPVLHLAICIIFRQCGAFSGLILKIDSSGKCFQTHMLSLNSCIYLLF